MVSYNLSSRAAIDIAEIYEYGIFTFGLKQAQKYLKGLETYLESLLIRPELRREASYLSKNIYFSRYKSHLIFFSLSETKTFVIRILEQHMDFSKHL